MSGHLNYRDRKTHFIFGDASASLVIGGPGLASESATRSPQYEILDSRVWTEFSSNIRSNFWISHRTSPETAGSDDKLVTQVGNKVFRDIVVEASRFLRSFLGDHQLRADDLHRLWLHRLNLKMLRALLRQLSSNNLEDRVPIVLQDSETSPHQDRWSRSIKHAQKYRLADAGSSAHPCGILHWRAPHPPLGMR